MDSPFFTNRRWYQQPDPTHRPFHPSVRGVPVYDVEPTPAPHRPVQRPAERASVPKVVRIPVQFFGSQQLDRTGAAVRIQKVFRGFSVRKNMRKIKDIKVEVDEIEEKLKKDEVVDLVKSDPKERLRMNESLMALLLKLDSISGVDCGVRLCRKSVIRQAIGLQERIDAIVAADLEAKGEDVDLEEIEEEDNSVPPLNPCENESNDEEGIVDVGVDCEVKVSENGEIAAEEEGSESKSNRELLEKMMKENEKMMSMMNQLFERSEMQTRMLNGLTHRIELLEKAVVCDRLRKKKKKKKVKSAAAACREN